jgi:ribosomal protein L1
VPLPLPAAVETVLTWPRRRFVESVELSVRLGIDPKRSDQAVRGVAPLPHGTGKRVRIAVFATGAAAEAARAAGADLVGGAELVAAVKEGGLAALRDADKVVATPAAMPMLAAIARLLGPRGLMPNPKTGTLQADVGAAVTSLRKGSVSFRADRYATVHCAIGRVDFSAAALRENCEAVLAALAAARPTAAKGGKASQGKFVKSVHLATTMGRGSVPVLLSSVIAAPQRRSGSALA